MGTAYARPVHASQTRTPDWLTAGSSIALATGVMNVATYGFTLLAARLLGPADYGGFAAVMALLLIVSVLQLGLQATGARRISADPDHVAQIERSVLRVTFRVAAAVGVLLLVLSPLVDRLLKLDSLPVAVLAAATAVPITIMGGQAGILQGEQRWGALALVYVANGVPRLVVGGLLLIWAPSELTAVLGTFLGQLAPVAVAGWALRGLRAGTGAVAEVHRARPVLRETLRSSQTLFAFFALSSVDIVIARNVLTEHDAGLYAGGLILTKAALFLPQFVVVVVFPALAQAALRRQVLIRALGLVLGLGIVASVGVWMLPDLAVAVIGGQEFAELGDRLWLFTAIGTALAMLQLLVYSFLARQGQRSASLVWAALVALLVLGYRVSTLDDLILLVLAIDVSLLVVMFSVSMWALSDGRRP